MSGIIDQLRFYLLVELAEQHLAYMRYLQHKGDDSELVPFNELAVQVMHSFRDAFADNAVATSHQLMFPSLCRSPHYPMF